MPLAEFEQGGKIERRAVGEAARLFDAGAVLGDYLEPPGIGSEPGLDQGVPFDGVGQRVAPAYVSKIFGRREKWAGQRPRGTGGRSVFGCGGAFGESSMPSGPLPTAIGVCVHLPSAPC